MNIDFDTLMQYLGILFLSYILYYVIFCVPCSNMVFSSHMQDELDQIKEYLAANGVKTFIKKTEYDPQGSEEMTLHVLESKKYKKALQLIKDYSTQQTQQNYPRS